MPPLRLFIGCDYDSCTEFMLNQPLEKLLTCLAVFLERNEDHKVVVMIYCAPNQKQVLQRVLGVRASFFNPPFGVWEHIIKYDGTFKDMHSRLEASFGTIIIA